LTYRESLGDIEACLRSAGGKVYHMGFRGKVARSTLADPNEKHDRRIFGDVAQELIGIARPLYHHRSVPVVVPPGQSFASLTPPSQCTHCLTYMATSLHLSTSRIGTVHDVNILDEIFPEVGA
jgi:hypothetical protein